ncbi:MAG: hypothetical protein J5998_06760, partial [Clostridia bacterium]|nr:hypothetical protein [Clostridia bacterium]
MDYAKMANMERWLRHPAMGDPSFDTFRKIGATVHKSDYPYEWAVNGSLFIDRDGVWYLYAGLYPDRYMDRPNCVSHFELYRSADKGQTWEWLGRRLDDKYMFDGVAEPSSSCPDVVLFYDERRGKYLLTYDWGTDNSTWEVAHNYAASDADAGAAVAWADSPAGPFQRIPQTVFRNSRLHGKYGRFDRFYATTVIPRKSDYLALILCDTGPNYAWGLAGSTAATPEDGFGEPVMLLNADLPTYYPAPMEFYPAFVVGDTVYAPATSGCANRKYQVLFAAKLEEAHLPSAWRLAQDGSLWHARPLMDERHGLFGQTINGMVDDRGNFTVMYASKDERNCGTLSVASRRWDEPFSDGFTVSGHAAPSVTLLRDAYKTFTLDAEFALHGGFADFLFDFNGKIGPDRPASDCAPNGDSLTKYTALRVSGRIWSLVRNDRLILTGRAGDAIHSVRLERGKDALRAWANGERLFDAEMPAAETGAPVGLRTDRFTVLNVSRFEVAGDSEPASYRYNDA